MARTAITPQQIDADGLNPSLEAANVDGHSIPLRRGVALLVRNGGGVATTVTIPTPAQVAGLDVAERIVSVPAAEDRYVTVGAEPAYRQPDGTVHVDISPTASVTVALLTL